MKYKLLSFFLTVLLLIAVTGSFINEGLAQDLSEDMMTLDSRTFSSRVLINPAVQEMIDEVSSDQIMYNLENLVSFYTRHTNSDTLSDTLGVGAARRWIVSQFQQYSEDSTTFALEPGYFSFDATICGINREHRNVIASLPGTLTPQRYVITMGHMDSRTINVCDAVSYAPSANDDGSGTSIAMEVARVMSRYEFESTALIMIVTGEDQGLYGSTAYASWALGQQMDIEAVITNDVVGNIEGCDDPGCPPGEPVIIDSTSVRHFSGPPHTGSSRQLARYMKLKAIEYMPDFTVNLIPAQDRPGRSGDHIPFYNRGYPAVRFTEPHENGDGSGNNGRQHNENDTISTYNTNAGYMANISRINIAGLASLALAPETPNGLEAGDVGDGVSASLNWPAEQTEQDFAGYRIAVRSQDELFYSDVIDAENVNEYILTGLTEGETVYLSISAYDNDDNESLFSDEISFTPISFPHTPQNLDATSMQNGVYLVWTPNSELDMDVYRIYRTASGQDEPELIATISHPDSEWTDNDVSVSTLYSYYITAVDIDQIESNQSDIVFGQLAAHDEGILILDGTLDGTGGPITPTDEQVDQYYDEIINAFNIGGNWDLNDSNSLGVQLYDAHLAPYSVVLFHSDRANARHDQDTTALRKYLENGGNLLISGWNLSYTLAGVTSEYFDFPSESFFEEYLKVDSIGISQPSNQDFISAPSLMPSIYPDLVIDSVKVSIFDHNLIKMEAFLGSLIDEPVTEAIHSYNSLLGEDFPLHGKPVCLRYLGADYKLVLFDVPLYFIRQDEAAIAVRQALIDLGEVYVDVDEYESLTPTEKFILFPNYPNPFNVSTTVSYSLSEPEDIKVVIYNLLGQEVEMLVDGRQSAGMHSLSWEAEEYPTGVYFCRLIAADYSLCIRMVLMK